MENLLETFKNFDIDPSHILTDSTNDDIYVRPLFNISEMEALKVATESLGKVQGRELREWNYYATLVSQYCELQLLPLGSAPWCLMLK